MTIQVIEDRFVVCKIEAIESFDLKNSDFIFFGKTDEEFSLVCREDMVPESCIVKEEGWKAFRVAGELDFGVIGILSKISTVLAENGISIFAISTYNTDYILIKEENLEKSLDALKKAGFSIL